MKKLLLILLCLPMIGFGQKTREHREIELPTTKKLASLPLTEQIKQISKYVVLIKVQ